MKIKNWFSSVSLMVVVSMLLAACGSSAVPPSGGSTSVPQMGVDNPLPGSSCAVSEDTILLWDPTSDPAAMLFISQAGGSMYPGKTPEEMAQLYFTLNVDYTCKTAEDSGLTGLYAILISRAAEFGVPYSSSLTPIAASSPLLMVLGGSTLAYLVTTTPDYQSRMAAYEGAHQIQAEDIILIASAVTITSVTTDLSVTLPGTHATEEEVQSWLDGLTGGLVLLGVRHEQLENEGVAVDIVWDSTDKACRGEVSSLFLYKDQNNQWAMDTLKKSFSHEDGPCKGRDIANAIVSLVSQIQRIADRLIELGIDPGWTALYEPAIQALFRIAMTALRTLGG